MSLEEVLFLELEPHAGPTYGVGVTYARYHGFRRQQHFAKEGPAW